MLRSADKLFGTVNRYAAASGSFTVAATATDIWRMLGSSTRCVKVLRIRLTLLCTTAAAEQIVFLTKRSTADTTGTFVASTMVPYDSRADAATVNSVGHYTANPGALGTLVGHYRVDKLKASLATDANGVNVWEWDYRDNPIILRGTAEQLSIFLNSVTTTGLTASVAVDWIETAGNE